MRLSSLQRPVGQVLGILVTFWFLSDMVYVVEEGYRSGLRAVWSAKFGKPVYTQILTEERMKEVHGQKKRDFLKGHNIARSSSRPWSTVEDSLETSLQSMFERTDPMKAWELKKLGSSAWQSVSQDLRILGRQREVSPRSGAGDQVLVYNRIPKSGSTLLLELLYSLGATLGYLVLRGKYHSYRYFGKNDRAGLGIFLEQASSRAKTVYVQHQYYINFTQPPHRLTQPLYVNIMRDPVEHLISSYFYKRTVILQHRSPQQFTQEERRVMQQPFEQCVVERRLECVYYGYTVHTNKTEQLQFRKDWSPLYLYPSDVLLYFCGHDPECSELGNPLALQKAKDNVDRNFAVVGLLEYMEESLTVMEHKLPGFFQGALQLYKSQEGQVRNKNTVKTNEISAEVKEVMKERLAPEYELYNHIKQKLFKQYRDITAKVS